MEFESTTKPCAGTAFPAETNEDTAASSAAGCKRKCLANAFGSMYTAAGR
jgi:hypothetical protein